MVKKGRIIAFFLIVIIFAGLFAYTVKPIAENIKLGLDLQGGFEVLYDVKPAEKDQKIDSAALKATSAALSNRIDILGVSEPNIQIETGNRIRVQLAGVTDQNQAREILSTEANLTFRDADDNIMLSGQDLVPKGAKMQLNPETNQPEVAIKLKSADKFGEVTQAVYDKQPNNQLVVWLDFEEDVDSYKAEYEKSLKGEEPKYVSAPNVNFRIDSDQAVITGVSADEGKQLAEILNSGALPVKLTEVYSTSVGAKFGEQALNETILAGLIAIFAVFAFMILYYRFPGFIACVTLSAYIYLMLLLFDWINGSLTLPGIAALILGIGIAVDANIIADERIKDELKKGRSVKAAFKEGNKHSLKTIIDAHFTTLIVGVVLFTFGTSSVKGFATMLIISIIVGFCTAVFGTRALMSLWVHSNFFNKRTSWLCVPPKKIMKLKEINNDLMLPTRFDKYDFVKHSKKFFIASTIITVLGIASLLIFGLNTGIDFSSGSRIEISSEKTIQVDQIEKQIEKYAKVEDTIYAGNNKNSVIIRTKGVLSKDKIAEMKTELKDSYGSEPNISTVSSTVGRELAKKALIAVLIASLGIIAYITVRFEWRMAITAIVSFFHDAFFIITVFSILKIEVDITFIAAVLTIIGYSINDTIVTFDRVRENLQKVKRLRSREDIANIVNISIRQTLTRSINTVFVVILTVIAMLIFGSHSIFNFNLALLVGLLIGVYSSILVAAPLWVVFKNKELDKKGEIKTVVDKRRSEEATV